MSIRTRPAYGSTWGSRRVLTRAATSVVQRIRSEIPRAPSPSTASYIVYNLSTSFDYIFKNLFLFIYLFIFLATKRVEEEKPLSRWSDHDDDGGAEEPDTVDDADNTSLEMTTSSHYSYGKATHPGGGASSRRSNNNNNNVQSPTQNKMSIIRSSGTAVRLQRSYYHLVAITSFFLVVYTLL